MIKQIQAQEFIDLKPMTNTEFAQWYSNRMRELNMGESKE